MVKASALWAERSCFVFIHMGFDFRLFVGGREETDRKVSYKFEINNVIKSAHTVSAGAICLVVPAHISYRFYNRNQFPQKPDSATRSLYLQFYSGCRSI